MAERTLSGEGREGFFIPYRHAASVAPPGPYAAIERLFADHEAEFREVLAEIEARAAALEALNGPPPRPRWDQDWFPRADGAAAYAMVVARRPRRIVEVGSGHSTRFMTEAARAAGLETRITCIDPAPRAALLDLAVEWRGELLSGAHEALFAALESGDIAFFDSSHVLVPGSDVDMILNRILPALRPGVIVHVHDILLPDPYPLGWEWRGYAEQNGLGPWLLSGGLKPLFSAHYAVTRMRAAEAGVLSRLKLRPQARETSLWAVRA
ncbi:class I SAM-dependent methyltransferase [Pikeienuella piscinae]|uniref:Class I SAM-dependent methyltransferase n=2 Tax=Pikeienuella piscinae TaxID=2748098 RepID=A0A7M3T6Q3_9RHOB|nr:class I SAM-dependent methyltransferase [Pikeienuella piscinae]